MENFSHINQKKLFWILNTFGWFIFSLIWFVLYTPEEIEVKSLIQFFSSNFLIPYMLTIGLRYYFRKRKVKSVKIWCLSFTILISVSVVSFIWNSVSILCWVMIYNQKIQAVIPVMGISSVKIMLSMLILIMAWSMLYFFISFAIRWQKERIEKEKALRYATQSKMEMLKNQINPHFLFNALNSISALIDEDSPKAQKIINELSDFLRYTLIYKNTHLISLKEELKIIDHFIQIQKIRFEEKFNVKYKIDAKAEQLLILPSLLYPLVENAIKHGMKIGIPLEIVISAEIVKEKLCLTVQNSGEWQHNSLNPNRSTNTGINNVKERLHCEYGSRALFDIITKDSKVIVQLILPYEQ